MNKAIAIWNERYRTERIMDHSRQNTIVSRDMLFNIEGTEMWNALSNATTIVEIGCGTGELARKITLLFEGIDYLALDISKLVIDFTRKSGYVGPITFAVGTFNTIPECDLTIAQSVLEHFADPFVPLDKMLVAAPQALILVPYDENAINKEGTEGGLSHLTSWNEEFLSNYNIIDSKIFKTEGWKVGINPRKWAVLIAKV